MTQLCLYYLLDYLDLSIKEDSRLLQIASHCNATTYPEAKMRMRQHGSVQLSDATGREDTGHDCKSSAVETLLQRKHATAASPSAARAQRTAAQAHKHMNDFFPGTGAGTGTGTGTTGTGAGTGAGNRYRHTGSDTCTRRTRKQDALVAAAVESWV